jgi:hypothetical protein
VRNEKDNLWLACQAVSCFASIRAASILTPFHYHSTTCSCLLSHVLLTWWKGAKELSRKWSRWFAKEFARCNNATSEWMIKAVTRHKIQMSRTQLMHLTQAKQRCHIITPRTPMAATRVREHIFVWTCVRTRSNKTTVTAVAYLGGKGVIVLWMPKNDLMKCDGRNPTLFPHL